MKKNKTIFLTGASGNMGWMGFQELYRQEENYNLVVLNLDSKQTRKQFAPYENDPRVKIIWGDLLDYADVLECVTGADYVLHVGGMVSPAADYFPKKTMKVNITAAKNIVTAIQSQPDPDAIKVVYIGTVAQTGDRNPPIHWGRTGDPIKISVYDHYAISKTIAEQIFAESGLKYWVSLRQSGIMYPGILNQRDPIMYHVPLNGVLEWATVEDSARLLCNVCKDTVPENFWRSFYNIGSGKEYRLTNYEFECLLLEQLGLADPKKVFDCNWFALQNFHGQWYADSDKLEHILHFRANTPIKEYFARMGEKMPAYIRLAKYVHPKLIRSLMMKRITRMPVYGTMTWLMENNKERISAYFGSRRKWKTIGDWSSFAVVRPSETPTLLNHGYDETKPLSQLTLEDMKQVAAFRGGECISTDMTPGDLFTPLRWRCAHGHAFTMTPNLVLRGGHWCPQELPMPWNYDEEAAVNPFFAQVWYPLHSKKEHHVYNEQIYRDFSKE